MKSASFKSQTNCLAENSIFVILYPFSKDKKYFLLLPPLCFSNFFFFFHKMGTSHSFSKFNFLRLQWESKLSLNSNFFQRSIFITQIFPDQAGLHISTGALSLCITISTLLSGGMLATLFSVSSRHKIKWRNVDQLKFLVFMNSPYALETCSTITFFLRTSL